MSTAALNQDCVLSRTVFVAANLVCAAPRFELNAARPVLGYYLHCLVYCSSYHRCYSIYLATGCLALGATRYDLRTAYFVGKAMDMVHVRRYGE